MPYTECASNTIPKNRHASSVIEAPSEKMTQEGDLQEFEAHRAYVREIDETFARTYGYGGGIVVMSAGVAWVALYFLNLMGLFASMVPAVTVGLVGLAVLRGRVKQKRTGLRTRVLGYCASNAVDPKALREYYAGQKLYPYFDAVLDDPIGQISDSTS